MQSFWHGDLCQFDPIAVYSAPDQVLDKNPTAAPNVKDPRRVRSENVSSEDAIPRDVPIRVFRPWRIGLGILFGVKSGRRGHRLAILSRERSSPIFCKM